MQIPQRGGKKKSADMEDFQLDFSLMKNNMTFVNEKGSGLT